MSDIQPNLQQLVEELQSISTKWKLFGLFLGIPDDDLEAIDVDKRNVGDKLYALCCKWPRIKPRGNWKDIVKALKKIKRLDLAERLEKKYIKHHHPSSDTSYDRMSTSLSPPYQSAVTSSPGTCTTDDNTETTHVDVPKEFKNDVDDLAVQFTYLLSCIKSGLKQKLINNQLNLDQLGRFISDLLSIPYEPLQVTEGRDEIDILFRQFRDYLSFVHSTDLLRHIDKKYLNCMLQDEIEKYDDDIDEFMKSTSVIAFKEMIRSKGLDKGIPVILRLNRHWERRTLYHLRHLTDYLFEDSSSLLKFDVIHHSVLTIKYTILRSLLLSLLIMVSRKVRGMKWAGVLSIQVDTILMTVSTNETGIHPSDALLEAAYFNDDQITNDIHLLANIGGDINTISTFKVSTGILDVTPLILAAEMGNISSLYALLHSKANPDIQANNGTTALFIASQNGQDQCVDLLLQSKANPDIQANDGVTALHIASQNGHDQCVDLLLQSKANPDIQANNGATALYIASQNGHDQCVDLLLQSKANPDIQANNDGTTALYIASENGHDQCVDLLLQSKANPDIQTNNGVTALYIASQNGHDQCVDLLLQSKANPNIQANNGATALLIASQNGHDQCVDLLLQSKANPDVSIKFGRTALLIAIIKKYHQIVKMLLEHNANPNVDVLGLNPLSAACFGGDLSIVSLLLQYGAKIETPGVLTIAIYIGYYDIAKSLINAGANVNVQEDDHVAGLHGTTPLMIASTHGNLPMVQLLLQSGADVMIQDKGGYTAYDAAKGHQHQKILTLLTIKLFEQARKYLSPSEESHESAIVTSPQDDDISLESQSSDTTPQFNNDDSESVSQQHQDNNERQTQESNLETIRNHFNSMLSSLQSSYKSITKQIELMFENEPRLQQPVY